MKVLMKSIEMIAVFDENGMLQPLRFRLRDADGESNVISVGKVQSIREERIAGNLMRIYDCISVWVGAKRPYQLRYELRTCRWWLYKL